MSAGSVRGLYQHVEEQPSAVFALFSRSGCAVPLVAIINCCLLGPACLNTASVARVVSVMGSNSPAVNLLEYLRSRSQVDCDSLDISCTSLIVLMQSAEFETDQVVSNISGYRPRSVCRLYLESGEASLSTVVHDGQS